LKHHSPIDLAKRRGVLNSVLVGWVAELDAQPIEAAPAKHGCRCRPTRSTCTRVARLVGPMMAAADIAMILPFSR